MIACLVQMHKAEAAKAAAEGRLQVSAGTQHAMPAVCQPLKRHVCWQMLDQQIKDMKKKQKEAVRVAR